MPPWRRRLFCVVGRLGASAAADLRYQADFAVGAKRLQIGVLVDRAVDRDRHAVLDLAAEPGETAVELEDQPAHRRRLDLELGQAAGELADRRARDGDARHAASAATSCRSPHAPWAATSADPACGCR